MIPHIIRPSTDADAGFVFSSWMRTMASEHGVPEDDEEARRTYWRANAPAVHEAMKRGRIVVAAARKDPARILAWACAEPPEVLHFAYTRQRGTMGRHGLCRGLLEHLGMARVARGTFYTEQGWPRVARCFESLTLDPYVRSA